MKRLLIIASFVCISLLTLHSKGLAEQEYYLSRIYPSGITIEGKLGHHFSERIVYWIGWSSLEFGTVRITRSYVTDPEYILFGSSLPPGLTFDPETGMIEGTPTAPGKWTLTAAVRCKQKGDNVYRGQGVWVTKYSRYNNKVWTTAEAPFTIDIKE